MERLADTISIPGLIGRVEDSCDSHGPFLNMKFKSVLTGKTVWSGCPECAGERIERETAEEIEAITRRSQVSEVERKLKHSCIPHRFRTKTLDDYKAESRDQEKALAIARDYAENFEAALKAGRSLVLLGRPGTGKSHLAASIANQAIKSGYTALFISAMSVIRRVRETYRRDSEETERQVIENFRIPDLLILDEVGQQRGTDDEKIILSDIVNVRYENVRPTIVISNLDIEGIKADLGERIIDRLREGGGRAVPFTWQSYRE